jgi:hypothetical protein
LAPEAIEVVRHVAQFGLTGRGQRIPAAVWADITHRLGLPSHDAAQDLYVRAKLAFAVLFYVVGGLGPPGALASPVALGDAVAMFRARFTGQSAWSVLKFAAHAAEPHATYAQVSESLYVESLRNHPDQAVRLGCRPGGPPPVQMLDAIEHRAADVFGVAEPHCVLSADGAPHRRDHANQGK